MINNVFAKMLARKIAHPPPHCPFLHVRSLTFWKERGGVSRKVLEGGYRGWTGHATFRIAVHLLGHNHILEVIIHEFHGNFESYQPMRRQGRSVHVGGGSNSKFVLTHFKLKNTLFCVCVCVSFHVLRIQKSTKPWLFFWSLSIILTGFFFLL